MRTFLCGLVAGVVATGDSIYVDAESGEQGYNARFQNLDGSAYTGSVAINVVCRFAGISQAPSAGALRGPSNASAPIR